MILPCKFIKPYESLLHIGAELIKLSVDNKLDLSSNNFDKFFDMLNHNRIKQIDYHLFNLALTFLFIIGVIK